MPLFDPQTSQYSNMSFLQGRMKAEGVDGARRDRRRIGADMLLFVSTRKIGVKVVAERDGMIRRQRMCKGSNHEAASRSREKFTS